MRFSPKKGPRFVTSFPQRILSRKGFETDMNVSPSNLGWAFLLAWVFCVFYLNVIEGMGGAAELYKTSSPVVGLFFDIAPVFASVAAIVATMAAEKRIGPPSSHRALVIASPLLACLGTPLLFAMPAGQAAAIITFALGAILTGAGSGVMWIMWGERYARIPQNAAELLAPASAVVAALVTLLASAMNGWVAMAFVSFLPVLSGACFALTPKDAGNEADNEAAPPEHARQKVLAVPLSMGRTIPGVFLACMFVCLAGALFPTQSARTAAGGAQPIIVVAIVFTVALALVSVLGPRRISISFFYRWMCPALVLGFGGIVLFGQDMGGYLASMMSASARFAFCLMTQMYFAQFAASGRATAVQAFGWGWIAVHFGDLVGVLVSTVASALVADGAFTASQVAVASMTALVFITMFVMEDKRSFHITQESEHGAEAPQHRAETESSSAPECAHESEGAVSNPAAEAARALDVRIEQTAHAFGLTPRETEVFGLLARGRSIPYVRDALVISRETAATHAKHIYAKCGVHSRQELIDLVQQELE